MTLDEMAEEVFRAYKKIEQAMPAEYDVLWRWSRSLMNVIDNYARQIDSLRARVARLEEEVARGKGWDA